MDNIPTILENLLRILERQKFDVTPYQSLLSYSPREIENYTVSRRDYVVELLREAGKGDPRSRLSFFVEKKDAKTVKDRCFVFFASGKPGKNIGKSEIEIMTIVAKKLNSASIIIVHSTALTPTALANISILKGAGYSVWPYNDIDLMYDPLVNIFVPEITLFTVEESKKFHIETGVSAGQMPRITDNDPIAMRLGAEAGMIIREKNRPLIPGRLTDIFYRTTVRPLVNEKVVKKTSKNK